jgi:hypothetical protein
MKILSDLEPWQTFRVLIFCHDESPRIEDITYYLLKYYRNCHIDFIGTNDIINNTTDSMEILNNIENDRYSYFYITTDNKGTRKEIRSAIKNSCGKAIHIQLYSKLVNLVNMISMRK